MADSHRLVQIGPKSVLSATRHHFRLRSTAAAAGLLGRAGAIKQRVSEGHALVPAAKLLKDAGALALQADGERADVVSSQ